MLRCHVYIPEKLTLSDQSSWGNKLSIFLLPAPRQALSPRQASAPHVQAHGPRARLSGFQAGAGRCLQVLSLWLR